MCLYIDDKNICFRFLKKKEYLFQNNSIFIILNMINEIGGWGFNLLIKVVGKFIEYQMQLYVRELDVLKLNLFF